MSKASISMSINGRSFHFEGTQAECNAKLNEFMREIFAPINDALRAAGIVNWRKVLGIRSQKVTMQQVERRFRALAKKHHPDCGGDRRKFEEIFAAREAARQELAV